MSNPKIGLNVGLAVEKIQETVVVCDNSAADFNEYPRSSTAAARLMETVLAILPEPP